MYETFDHTADLGLRVSAPSLTALLEEAARGLTSLLVADPSAIQAASDKSFAFPAGSPEDLLVDWLSELIYQFDVQSWLGAEFRVRIDGDTATFDVRGEDRDETRHSLANEVKAITYHQLRVEPTADGWEAEFIVDI